MNSEQNTLYTCPFPECQKRYANRQCLFRHKQGFHGWHRELELEGIHCDTCDKMYKNKASYRTHTYKCKAPFVQPVQQQQEQPIQQQQDLLLAQNEEVVAENQDLVDEKDHVGVGQGDQVWAGGLDIGKNSKVIPSPTVSERSALLSDSDQLSAVGDAFVKDDAAGEDEEQKEFLAKSEERDLLDSVECLDELRLKQVFLDKVYQIIGKETDCLQALKTSIYNIDKPAAKSTRSSICIQEDKMLADSNAQVGYGEATQASMGTIINVFKQYGLDSKDAHFVDIGSGFGKPVFHAAISTKARCYGIELVEPRVEYCLKMVEKLTQEYANESVVLEILKRIEFTRVDAGNVHRYQNRGGVDSTHFYSFNWVMSEDDNRAIVEALNQTTGFQILGWCCNEKTTIEKFGLKGVKLVDRKQARMVGSGQVPTIFFYQKQPMQFAQAINICQTIPSIQVLEAIPTKAHFYDGLLYLKPFVVKGFLKKEPLFSEYFAQSAIQKFPLPGIHQLKERITFIAYSEYQNMEKSKRGSFSLPLFHWTENPLKANHPSFMTCSDQLGDWSYAFVQEQSNQLPDSLEGAYHITSLHKDDMPMNCAWMILLKGVKKFWFLPPSAPVEVQQQEQPFFSSYDVISQCIPMGLQTVQMGPGDLICFPGQWFHEVHNLEESCLAVTNAVAWPPLTASNVLQMAQNQDKVEASQFTSVLGKRVHKAEGKPKRDIESRKRKFKFLLKQLDLQFKSENKIANCLKETLCIGSQIESECFEVSELHSVELRQAMAAQNSDDSSIFSLATLGDDEKESVLNVCACIKKEKRREEKYLAEFTALKAQVNELKLQQRAQQKSIEDQQLQINKIQGEGAVVIEAAVGQVEEEGEKEGEGEGEGEGGEVEVEVEEEEEEDTYRERNASKINWQPAKHQTFLTLKEFEQKWNVKTRKTVMCKLCDREMLYERLGGDVYRVIGSLHACMLD